MSAWIRPDAFDDELRRKLAQAINRGVTVRIAWGFRTNWNRSSPGHKREEAQHNKRLGEEALAQLDRMLPEISHGRLVTNRVETHQKFIVCDDLFCVYCRLSGQPCGFSGVSVGGLRTLSGGVFRGDSRGCCRG